VAEIPRPGSYERATPIFDRTQRRFHAIARLVDVRTANDGHAVHLRFETRGDGATMHGRLTFPDPDVLRVQLSFAEPPGDHLTEMLVATPPTKRLTIAETSDDRDNDDGDDRDNGDDILVISAGGTEARLSKDPWRLEFGNYATEPADTSFVEPVAEPGGYASTDGAISCYETFRMAPGEELWGLGERFLGPSLRGRRLIHWIDEPFGTNTTDRVYKSVPLVVSSRGYGVFVHQPERAVFDLGAGSTASASVLVESDQLDYFVMNGQPKDVLRHYTALTGRPPVPPDWSFGIWMSKCMYGSREEVAGVLDEARRHGLRVNVVGLDPKWLAHRPEAPVDFCDFIWNDKDFGPIDDFVEWLHGQDIKLCLWVNPHMLDSLETYDPSRLVEYGRSRDPFYPGRAFVDLTGDGATWWREEMTRLLASGIDAFKLDYGELLPADVTMADGRSGAEVHNLYPLLASQIAYDAGVPLAFTRAGTAGSQRYPLHWAGDSQSTWAGFAGCLRGGLAAAWSGFAHWSTDVGGFYRRDVWADESHPTFGFAQPEPELYIRWLQFGHLLSHTRYHGTQGREPWLFGDDAVAAAASYGELRQRLRPYLLRCAEEAAATGCPILRPMAMEFPDDPSTRPLDRQYMLGPDLLVRPVLEPGGRDVEVYVPAGGWVDHFTGEQYDGPRWVVYPHVPLQQLPLLVREGTDPFAAA
jgi:alpha-D-xyloside xylohydrolase